MIIIQQDFNKVPLCLEGTKENSPFAVSGPALVFVVVSGITPVLFFGKMEMVDLQENDPDQMQTWQWTWLKGRGNM